MVQKNKKSSLLVLLSKPLVRTLVSLALALMAAALVPLQKHGMLLVFLVIWIVFSLSYLTISWIILATRNVEHIKTFARRDDGSVAYVFAMVILSAFASMLIVLLLMISGKAGQGQAIYLLVSIAGILLSWTMVHTLYTFHYAHMYYDVADEDDTKEQKGLEFPGEEQPDYIDFAYFSFVIGCTFQVSDVEISSRKIRRSVLLHGILSFLLNTFVVALTINLIAGLRN